MLMDLMALQIGEFMNIYQVKVASHFHLESPEKKELLLLQN